MTKQDMVVAALEKRRGNWKSICQETGIPYARVTNLMSGARADLTSNDIEKLHTYLSAPLIEQKDND